MAYKPEVIFISFKTTYRDNMILFDCLQDKFKKYRNKRNYIKAVLRDKMDEEKIKNE